MAGCSGGRYGWGARRPLILPKNPLMPELAIHPLTPERWSDLVALFETDSICRMCWCTAHRLPSAIRRDLKGDERKKHLAKAVKSGPPPGLLAYRRGEAVGWMAIAPRPQTPEFNLGAKASAVEDEEDAENPAVWAATCFFIRKDARGLGIAEELLKTGIAWARKNGAKRLEAAPMAHEERRSTAGLFVGPKRVFDRAGFTAVIERKPGRPLMRKHLVGAPPKTPEPSAPKTAAKKSPAKKKAGAKR